MKNNNRWQRIVGIIVAIVVCLVSTEYLNSQNETDINENNVETVDNQETNLDAVKFVRTVDGDTIIVEDSTGANKRVRMIGIDTPESVAQEEERNNEYGVMASDYTKDLLSKAGTVYLEYDIDSDDQYDRVLAYVWLEDVDDTFNVENIKNSMVNAIIVE
ncbi:MAG: thermonuclease family protein, partial [Pseudobutyrivibrio sp.]|nr:thermonuclease family protein [Pseudobutyrivibrio sp.]